MPYQRLASCGHCGVSISGTALQREHPETGIPTVLCVTCAETPEVSVDCAGCHAAFYPASSMRRHGGRVYCVGCEPVERVECGHCGQRVRRTAAVLVAHETAFCGSRCARSAGWERDGSQWFRNDSRSGIRVEPWQPSPAPFQFPDDGDLSFGVEIEAKIRRVPLAWEVHHDGSIQNGHNTPTGDFAPWEIVSPILRGRAGADSLCGALAAMDGHFMRANNAGIHVHVGVEYLDGARLLALFHHWETWGEDFAAGLVGKFRFRRSFCQSVKGGNVLRRVRERVRGFESSPVSEFKHRFETSDRLSRYWTLNPCAVGKHGTVEFRLWSCATDTTLIQGWTAFCAHFVSTVTRPGFPEPGAVRDLLDRQGVMRAGLRLMRAGNAFALWTARRWKFLRSRSSLSEDHSAHPRHHPWGSPERFPGRLREPDPSEVAEVEEGPPAGQEAPAAPQEARAAADQEGAHWRPQFMAQPVPRAVEFGPLADRRDLQPGDFDRALRAFGPA